MFIIDFENTFKPILLIFDRELSVMEFYSPQKKSAPELIRVEIKPHLDKLLPDVYNLAMGPLNEENKINDKIRLKHINSNRLFSTIILFATAFLSEYPVFTIGLDGSDDIRATLYHSMFLTNRKHLSQYIICIGVDWYVKLLRNQLEIEVKSDGTPFFKPRPEQFDYARPRYDLYRYYMFQLKK
jgi:hypothetical protein